MLNIKYILQKRVVYVAIGLFVLLIIIANYDKKKLKTSEDVQVSLFDLRLSLNSLCDDNCIDQLKEELSQSGYIYEVNFVEDDQISVIYNVNNLKADGIVSSITMPVTIISNDKVVMKCPEQCSYCDSETGVCKAFE